MTGGVLMSAGLIDPWIPIPVTTLAVSGCPDALAGSDKERTAQAWARMRTQLERCSDGEIIAQGKHGQEV